MHSGKKVKREWWFVDMGESMWSTVDVICIYLGYINHCMSSPLVAGTLSRSCVL